MERKDTGIRPGRRSAAKGPPSGTLRAVYEALFARWGPQHWWPGQTPFEVMVGAILTQNTAWSNVERAIAELRRRRWLTPGALRRAPRVELAKAIRSSGHFNVKAMRLRAFLDFLFRRYGGRLSRLRSRPDDELRRELLDVRGVGPETADSILLYALERPVFVIDAYTRRFLVRHGWARPRATYEELANLFGGQLERDIRVFNEYHALIVRLGKEHCRARPRCEGCPLHPWLSGDHPGEQPA